MWLLFWALQYSWLALFPLMIGRALFRTSRATLKGDGKG